MGVPNQSNRPEDLEVVTQAELMDIIGRYNEGLSTIANIEDRYRVSLETLCKSPDLLLQANCPQTGGKIIEARKNSLTMWVDQVRDDVWIFARMPSQDRLDLLLNVIIRFHSKRGRSVYCLYTPDGNFTLISDHALTRLSERTLNKPSINPLTWALGRIFATPARFIDQMPEAQLAKPVARRRGPALVLREGILLGQKVGLIPGFPAIQFRTYIATWQLEPRQSLEKDRVLFSGQNAILSHK